MQGTGFNPWLGIEYASDQWNSHAPEAMCLENLFATTKDSKILHAWTKTQLSQINIYLNGCCLKPLS